MACAIVMAAALSWITPFGGGDHQRNSDDAQPTVKIDVSARTTENLNTRDLFKFVPAGKWKANSRGFIFVVTATTTQVIQLCNGSNFHPAPSLVSRKVPPTQPDDHTTSALRPS